MFSRILRPGEFTLWMTLYIIPEMILKKRDMLICCLEILQAKRAKVSATNKHTSFLSEAWKNPAPDFIEVLPVFLR